MSGQEGRLQRSAAAWARLPAVCLPSLGSVSSSERGTIIPAPPLQGRSKE